MDPPIITPAYEYRTDASLYGTKDSAQEDTVKSFRTVRVRVVGPYGQRLQYSSDCLQQLLRVQYEY